MSAICGVYSLINNEMKNKDCEKMMERLSIYPHDAADEWTDRDIFLGSILKYDTPESKNEKLPNNDLEKQLVITADAIIDNREELFTYFDINMAEGEWVTDSELILRSYIKWGDECPKYLVGDFSFAIWDKNKEELFCVRDHVGKRSVYYKLTHNIFAFSTLSMPLLELNEGRKLINEEWIADFLSVPGPIQQIQCWKTVFKGIYELPPAHSLKVNKEGIRIKKYWEPLKLPKLNFRSNEEYEEEFIKIFSESVKCRLRSIKSVGVMLSGGLDSGSIACIAAKELEKNNSNLKAFTAVPMKDYKEWLPKTAVADERGYIEKVLKKYNNIDITYCDLGKLNSLSNIDKTTQMLEEPHKIIQNLFWIEEIAKLASQAGCGVLLDGQSGNYTVSFGNLSSYLLTLFRKGKWIKIQKEIKSYCILNNRVYSSVIKHFLRMIFPKHIKNICKALMHRDENNQFIPVKAHFSNRYKVNDRLKKAGLGKYDKKYRDVKEAREFLLNSILFNQAGNIETKISLQSGIVKRDPTRDKRVIEFCMRIPEEQFVQKGQERSLIRRAMKGILPDEIRLNYSVRGIQSADWVQRLLPKWSDIKSEIIRIKNEGYVDDYIDFKKIDRVLDEIGDNPSSEHNLGIQLIVTTIILNRFIKSMLV